jgi:hypothetical protein
MHWTENSKQIFQDMKLRGLVPNFYFHLSVSDIYIPTIGPQMQQQNSRGGQNDDFRPLTYTLGEGGGGEWGAGTNM